MRKTYWVILLAALLLALCGGCGGSREEEAPPPPAESQQPEPAPPPEAKPEPAVPAGTNPLTGLPLEPEQESLRPAAVILNNLKAAQPQLGTAQADIIYEVPVEGGITRMLALYQTLEGVGNLGSVRSARPYYLELALGHDALLVHAGGSQEAYSNFRSWKVDHMDGVRGTEDAKIFWRDPDRRRNNGYEHSLITSGEKILDYLALGKLETEHPEDWQYPQTFQSEGAQKAGEAAERVQVKFSAYKTGVFTYDAAAGAYLAEQYGQAQTDGATGKQVSAVNLLVLETRISVIPGDQEGRLRVQTTGEGSGRYFCGGKTVPIQWSRADRNSPFAYALEDGSPLALAAGNSYVCILSPKTGQVHFE